MKDTWKVHIKGEGHRRHLASMSIVPPKPCGRTKHWWAPAIHAANTYCHEARERLKATVRTQYDMTKAEIRALEKQYGCKVRVD